MNEEILKRIDALAAKLSVTAAHLYGVLVKQAQMTAYIDGAWLLASLIVFIIGYTVAKRGFKMRDNWDDVPGVGIWLMVLGCVLSLTSIIVFTSNTAEFFTAIVNPEYLEIQQLGQLFK